MKTILGATALCLTMIMAGATPAGAQDINIYVDGDEGAKFGPGSNGEGRGRHMCGQGGHYREGHRRHGGHGHHGWGRGSDREEGWAHRGREHGGKMRHARRMDRLLDLIKLYDQDGDDKITQTEIDEARAKRLAEFDGDGNGMLSLQEYEALWLDAMRERMVDRFQSHDDDGDGQVTVEEFSKKTARLVIRRDRNADGTISLEDTRHADRNKNQMRDRDDDE